MKKDVKVELEPSRRVGRMIGTARELFDRHVSPPPAHGNQRLRLRGVQRAQAPARHERERQQDRKRRAKTSGR